MANIQRTIIFLIFHYSVFISQYLDGSVLKKTNYLLSLERKAPVEYWILLNNREDFFAMTFCKVIEL
ncbi:MAG: hypothetical protein RR633_19345 [Acinetobacter sp.]